MNKLRIRFNKKTVVHTDISSPWRFRTDDNREFDAGYFCEKTESAGAVTIYHYSNNAGTFRAKRICFSDSKNAVFIFDIIKSTESICVYSDFTIKNQNCSVSCNIADKNKLVIRNSNCGLKHFRLHSTTDGTDILSQSGLMMPVSVQKSGDVVYSMYDGLHSFGKLHINCFGMATDNLSDVIYWHFLNTENGYKIEAPSKKGGYEVRISEETVSFFECSAGECLINIKI